jgi:hypothetical protein
LYDTFLGGLHHAAIAALLLPPLPLLLQHRHAAAAATLPQSCRHCRCCHHCHLLCCHHCCRNAATTTATPAAMLPSSCCCRTGAKLTPPLHRREKSASSFIPHAVYLSPSMIDTMCVLCGVGYFYFYVQKSEIFGQIYPTGHPTIPPKTTLVKVGFFCLQMKVTHTK